MSLEESTRVVKQLLELIERDDPLTDEDVARLFAKLTVTELTQVIGYLIGYIRGFRRGVKDAIRGVDK